LININHTDKLSRKLTVLEMSPKVSVLMSVYNKGKFLRNAIDSILGQSFSDFEFIIKDNCSTDDSVAIIESYHDHRIIFTRNTRNLGPGGSLNNCIGEARGEYITIAHGDDIWDIDFLAVNIAYLEQHPSASLAHSLMSRIDEQDNATPAQLHSNVGEYRIDRYEDVLQRLFKSCYILTPTVFVKRASMKYYENRYIYTCDWSLYLNLAVARENFIFINRPLIQYRVSSSSETAIGMRDGDLVLEGYLTLRNFFNNYPEYSQYRNASLRRYSRNILRRSRDSSDREKLKALLCYSLLCYPLQIINPVFHVYLFLGILFGPSGVRSLKIFTSKKKRS